MTLAIYPSLSERVVFVTGGATGIGRAMVEAFHQQGAKVAFIDWQAEAALALATLLPGVWHRACDVTRIDDLREAIFAAAAALGPVTVLINNVANDLRQAAAETDPDAWRSSLAVNLDPAFFAATTVQPIMRAAGGGSVINLSSINALLGPPQMAAYVAAKGAINALTKSLAREWGPDRIRVNAVSPGWVVTDRQLELWLTPAEEEAWSKQVALAGRLLPHDVARLALFLASDDARMITGQNLVVDAGRT